MRRNNKKPGNKKKKNFPPRRGQPRRGGFGLLNSRPFSLRTSPVSLGPGEALSRVTNRYQFSATEEASANINVMYDVFTNAEFESKTILFRFFKIVGLKVIVPPRLNTDQAQLPTARLMVDWANGTAENISLDDGAKEIFPYSTTPRVYRFKSPDVLIKAPTGLFYVNYSNWMPSNQTTGFVPPGYIKITGSFAFNFTVETLVLFKGMDTSLGVSASASLKKVVPVPTPPRSLLQKLLEKEEDEKEEEKEEKDSEEKLEDSSEYTLSKPPGQAEDSNKEGPPLKGGDVQELGRKARIKYLVKVLERLQKEEEKEEDEKEEKKEKQEDKKSD